VERVNGQSFEEDSIMNRLSMAWFVCIVALVALALVAPYARTSAAQKSDETSRSETKAPSARLPNYYGRVTTEEQRSKLREVVEQYAPQIQEKREELQALIAKRDAALAEMLTADQREEIAKLRAAAAARRQSAADANDNTKGKAKKAKSGQGKKAA
jgi:hypothetical protein